MNRPTLLRRSTFSLALVVVVAVTASGCNGIGGTTAATVEGHDISTRRVISLLQDRKVAAEREPSSGALANLSGPGKDTFPKLAFSETLNQIVLADLVHRDLERRHLSVTAADRAAAKSSLEQSAGASTISNLPKGLRDFVIDFDADQAVLKKQLAKKTASNTAKARALYAQIKSRSPEQLLQFCVTGAVFATKANATSAQKRLNAGASLTAAVKGLSAQQVVTKEQCAAASQLPPEVQSLGVGRTTAPIANQGAFVLLRLARRKTLTFDEARAQLEKSLPDPLQIEMGKLAAKADIHVDPRFGRWNRQAGRVDPPAGTPTTTVPATTPAAPSGGTGSSTGGASSSPSGG